MFSVSDLHRLLDIYKFTEPVEPNTVLHDLDCIPIEYHVNEYMFRTDKFNNQELMTLGCSMTFGDGLPEEYRWANLLSNLSNQSLVNLGFSGDSAIGQVQKAFWYFKHFGNPKTIAAFFPMYRMPFPHIEGKNRYEQSRHRINGKLMNYSHNSIIPNMDSFEKLSQKPHKLDSIISYEATLYYTNLAILTLDQYCKTNNIKFVWTVWDILSRPRFGIKNDELTSTILQYFRDTYDTYVDMPSMYWEINSNGLELDQDGKELTCHQEFSYDLLFHKAADIAHGLDRAHFGLHRNIHIANDFYDRIKV